MRLLQTDVPAFIADTLNNIRAGAQAANGDGFVVELNGQEVSFVIEIVQREQSVTQVTETIGSDEKNGNTANPSKTTTTVQGGAITTRTEGAVTETTTTSEITEITTEGGSTDTETVTHESAQSQGESGVDTEVTLNHAMPFD